MTTAASNGRSASLLSPKRLTRLIGAEFHLMRDAGVLRRFYVSSILVLLICLVTAVSVFYAIALLFHTLPIELTLSAFFSLLFVCIYIFLINTFAKAKRVNTKLLNASNVIRIGFIIFMAYLIAQPLLTLLFSAQLETAVAAYRTRLLDHHLEQIDNLSRKELSGLRAKREYYYHQQQAFSTDYYDRTIAKLDSSLKAVANKSARLKNEAAQTISRNSFFLFRILQVYRQYPIVWLLSLFVIVLFVLPGYLVYSISSANEYYVLKKQQEYDLVLSAYTDFLEQYPLKSEVAIIFSRYEDPPFNQVRKQAPEPLPAAEFFQKYLHNA